MARILFEDRRTALLFAGSTIVLTMALIGPRDGGGLDSTVEQINQNRAAASAPQQPQQMDFAEDPVEVAQQLERESDFGSEDEELFGDYSASDPVPEQATAPAPAPPRMIAQAQPFRPGGPIGGPVKADGPGIAVPHSDDAREAAASSQIPVSVVRTPKSSKQ
jgi:hypothetical protein